MVDDPAELQQTVERMHGCKAVLVATELVSERFKGKPAWEVVVYHFILEGHPIADLAFAWSSPIEGSTKREFSAALRSMHTQTAQDAVRTTIAANRSRQ